VPEKRSAAEFSKASHPRGPEGEGISFVKNTKTILIVEDEKIVANALSARLEKQGYATVTVQSGEKALKEITNNEINLVLMDIELGSGNMDGAEAARRILKKREIPVVFCSAHTEKEYVDRVKDIKSYGYVHKNSGDFVLLQTVRMALELFETHRQLKAEYEKRNQAGKRWLFRKRNWPPRTRSGMSIRKKSRFLMMKEKPGICWGFPRTLRN
jgi:CheY-like chemotaxis protein